MRRALVIGGAECVTADLKVALALFNPDRVYAVNDVAAAIPHIDALVTLHPEKVAGWRADRAKAGHHSNYEVVGPLINQTGTDGFKAAKSINRRVDYRFSSMNASGSSSLFAVKVALDDKCDRVVLAGCPMTIEDGHFLRVKPWTDCMAFRQAWGICLPHIKDKVRSVSGWTKELLGEPTPEWLEANTALAGEPSVALGETPATGTARG